MHHNELLYLADLVKQQSGIQVSADKAYLFESRLLPIARQFGYATISDLVQRVRGSGDPAIIEAIIEAMTTNESFFFRDQHPFDRFGDFMLPELKKARGGERQLRIWSAAASTGQEPYSLSMCVEEAGSEYRTWRVEILATDISGEALDRAREGIYSQFEVQRGLPVQMLVKYFDQNGARWRIKDSLRKRIEFRRHNLVGNNRSLGLFDIIFIRNVLIYFDMDTKRRILNDVAAMLRDPGFVVLGGTESVLGVTSELKAVEGKRGIFVRNAVQQERRARPGERAAGERAADVSGAPDTSKIDRRIAFQR
ncbi:MAG: protein-glutamate O-methyltransferase CheR [Geminicoccaceae bacterium]